MCVAGHRLCSCCPPPPSLHVSSEGGCPSCSHGNCLCPNLVLGFAANSALLCLTSRTAAPKGLLCGRVLWPLGAGARTVPPFPGSHTVSPNPTGAFTSAVIVVNNSDG